MGWMIVTAIVMSICIYVIADCVIVVYNKTCLNKSGANWADIEDNVIPNRFYGYNLPTSNRRNYLTACG